MSYHVSLAVESHRQAWDPILLLILIQLLVSDDDQVREQFEHCLVFASLFVSWISLLSSAINKYADNKKYEVYLTIISHNNLFWSERKKFHCLPLFHYRFVSVCRLVTCSSSAPVRSPSFWRQQRNSTSPSTLFHALWTSRPLKALENRHLKNLRFMTAAFINFQR